MKKTFIIVGLLVLAASCQKEVIRPNNCMQNNGAPQSTAITTVPDGDNPDPNAPEVSGGTSGTDGTTDPDDNGITDPMRKKDKKDSK